MYTLGNKQISNKLFKLSNKTKKAWLLIRKNGTVDGRVKNQFLMSLDKMIKELQDVRAKAAWHFIEHKE